MMLPIVTGRRFRLRKAPHVRERRIRRSGRGGEAGVERGDQQSQRDEVHVGDGMLEPRGHEGADRRHDGQDAIGRRAGRQGQPDGQADQRVAQHAERDRLREAELDLRVGDRERRGSERAAPAAVGASEIDQRRGAAGPDEVPGEDDEPVAQERPRGHATARPRHDDEVVSREELGPAHHDEDQADAECHAGQNAEGAPGGRPSSGERRGREDPAQRDEGAGEDRQREGRGGVHGGLPDADLFGSRRHLGGQERIELPDTARCRVRRRHLLPALSAAIRSRRVTTPTTTLPPATSFTTGIVRMR